MQEIAIDDPKFDELLDRVVRALLALDGSGRLPTKSSPARRAPARRKAKAA